jgi:hypothetical protein
MAQDKRPLYQDYNFTLTEGSILLACFTLEFELNHFNGRIYAQISQPAMELCHAALETIYL